MFFGPMTAMDFSCSDLQEAWIGYQEAIKFIRSMETQTEFHARLIEAHQDKIACLERAQWIINTHRAIERR